VLTTDTETPVVSKTTVSADLLEALEILTELGVDTVSKDVGVLAIDDIALSVDEPCRDLVLGGVLEDGDDSLELFGGELTSALVQIDIGLLADQVRVSATDTLDLGQGVHNLLLSVNIGVEKTENELEVRLLSRDERHDGQLWRSSCSESIVGVSPLYPPIQMGQPSYLIDYRSRHQEVNLHHRLNFRIWMGLKLTKVDGPVPHLFFIF
jgi:hypothetical protein